MSHQDKHWEGHWREELACHESTPLPGDWAGMEGLLDGGTPAPPEPPAQGPSPGAGPTGHAAWTKGLFLTLGLATATSLGYFLTTTNEPPPEAALLPVSMIDTLPPGYEYDVKTYKRLDREGKVLSVSHDTIVIPVRPASQDTIYRADERGNIKKLILLRPRSKVSGTALPFRPKRYRMDTLFRLDGGGNIIGVERIDSTEIKPSTTARPRVGGNAMIELPSLSNFASPTSSAPAAPPPNPRSQRIEPIRIKVPHDLPSSGELLRIRLLKIVKDNPLPLKKGKGNNGFYPAYEFDY